MFFAVFQIEVDPQITQITRIIPDPWRNRLRPRGISFAFHRRVGIKDH